MNSIHRNMHLNIGELIVSRDPVVISTVLGSCVAVSLYCRGRDHGSGGLIHYALPLSPPSSHLSDPFRYGDIAIVSLIEELERLTGSERKHFQAKIIGGATGQSEFGLSIQAGPGNVEIARAMLESFGIPIIGEDIGGPLGRKVFFHTGTGRLQVGGMGQRLPIVESIARDRSSFSRVLAIGASTGGTEALRTIMRELPEDIPPTLIVQHIPPAYSMPFAHSLDELCRFEVKEAEDGDLLMTSRVLIAPGGKQMKLKRDKRGFYIRITDDLPVNRHKPSVDYLFDSVAAEIGPRAVGVLLTGMGDDGAKGLLKMRRQGARTIGQDEETSVVYGMPRVASEVGALEQVAPLMEIPSLILKALGSKRAA